MTVEAFTPYSQNVLLPGSSTCWNSNRAGIATLEYKRPGRTVALQTVEDPSDSTESTVPSSSLSSSSHLLNTTTLTLNEEVVLRDPISEAVTQVDVVSKQTERSKTLRFRSALPGYDGPDAVPGLDRLVLSNAIPAMINLAVVPFVNSVDTFWVGRMGIALALAGQAAANQAFFTVFFLVAFLPTITAPLVAAAVGSGNKEEARTRVSESLFLCNIFGLLGTIFLIGFPRLSLGMVLPQGAPAFEYATPYIRLRGLSVIPALLSATGFAAYRGMLDTVTPLKVSLATNLLNLVLDPLLIFYSPFGFVGAAIATVLAETASGLTYFRLLLKRKLSSFGLLFKPPPLHSILPIIQGGLSILGRQAAINVGLIAAARRAQSMDPTGVAAAAYGIVMQLHSIGVVLHVGVQSTAAALIPASLAKSGEVEARKVGDRIFAWSSILGLLMGATQLVALPFLVPLFSPLPEVQEAVKVPAMLSAFLHLINGPVFAGEGAMLGLKCFRELMLATVGGIGCMIISLATLGRRGLNGIMWSLIVWSVVQAIAVFTHYLHLGPLAVKNSKQNKA